jgi:hypothetical protein
VNECVTSLALSLLRSLLLLLDATDDDDAAATALMMDEWVDTADLHHANSIQFNSVRTIQQQQRSQ